MTALSALQPMPPQASAPSVGRGGVRSWMSVDLGALGLALDGARPLPAGSARLVAWGGPAGIARRVPASAFVNVRRRVAPDAVTSASRRQPGPAAAGSIEPASAASAIVRDTEAPAAPGHPLRRGRAVHVLSPRAGMPRRHKLMLAAAAVVMTLGFFGAGAGRPGQAAGAAPADLARSAS